MNIMQAKAEPASEKSVEKPVAVQKEEKVKPAKCGLYQSEEKIMPPDPVVQVEES